MAEGHSIPHFPDDIERDAFGYWLSGFTDGEGCFQIYRRADIYSWPHVQFDITLRADDAGVLSLIRSFWRAGQVAHYEKNPFLTKSKPIAKFSVRKIKELMDTVVPHFVAYPLRAKKQRDFIIWRRAVELCYRVSRRRRRPNDCGRKGTVRRWADSERDDFDALMAEIRRLRKFDPAPRIPEFPRTLDRSAEIHQGSFAFD